MWPSLGLLSWPSHGLLLITLLVAGASTASAGDVGLTSPGNLHLGSNVKHDLLQESVEAMPSLTFKAKGWPDGTCKVSGQTCEFKDNVLSIVPNIHSLDECKLLCGDNSDCAFYSYFGEDNSQFSEICVLFSSCDNLVTCTDCSTTQYGNCSLEPFSFCSLPLVGHNGDNLLQFLPNLPNQTDCWSACLNTSGCTYYTHHNASSQMVPNGCFLLSSLQGPLAPCDFCQTGPANCSSSYCMFSKDGEASDSLMLTDSSQQTIVEATALGICTLTVIAVGGGGYGEKGGSYRGGGGSGFVEWKQLNLTTEYMTFNVKVGGAGETTTVWDLITATSGHSASGFNGGDGFCGGGGVGGNGGTNGGDGEDGYGHGGAGSHMKLDEIPTSGFALSPGKGGSGGSGGGGGGLLVDGEPAGGDKHDGEGYGGGGRGYGGRAGKPGVVLLMFT